MCDANGLVIRLCRFVLTARVYIIYVVLYKQTVWENVYDEKNYRWQDLFDDEQTDAKYKEYFYIKTITEPNEMCINIEFWIYWNSYMISCEPNIVFPVAAILVYMICSFELLFLFLVMMDIFLFLSHSTAFSFTCLCPMHMA